MCVWGKGQKSISKKVPINFQKLLEFPTRIASLLIEDPTVLFDENSVVLVFCGQQILMFFVDDIFLLFI